jgi:pyruvate dehydrogenase E2 component (dihydrolipoamide acetyltransferase)
MATQTQNLLEFRLPDIGEGVVEGELVAWLVKPGDLVSEDQAMFEVMTDKATVEIPSPRKGKIVRTIGEVGEVINVGDVVVVIEMEAGAVAPVTHGHHGTAAPAAAPEASNLPLADSGCVLYDKLPEAPEAVEHAVNAFGRILATPATRKAARDLGVELTRVPGTGPKGRITKEDVRRVAEGGTMAQPQPTVVVTEAAAAPVVQTQAMPAAKPAAPVTVSHAPALEERIPLRGLRKKISEKMAQSVHTAAHFTVVDEADVTELVKLRSDSKEAALGHGVKLTFVPFIMKAVAIALKEFPMLNASLDEATQELVLKKVYNIGLAVSADMGLIVPVVRDVDKKSLFQVAREVEEVAERARKGKNALDELQGGTFTVSSIGNIGGLIATPVINYPEVGILAVTKIQKRPVIRNDEIVARDMLYLSLSFDHRVVDGADGVKFCNRIIQLLENPTLLLMA